MNTVILSTVLALVVSPGIGAEELAAAPAYTIPWFTVDAGGGVASLATFRLVGTAGQPDAGFSIEGATAVTSGFWSVSSGNPIFADGFESGGSGAWSLQVP